MSVRRLTACSKLNTLASRSRASWLPLPPTCPSPQASPSQSPASPSFMSPIHGLQLFPHHQASNLSLTASNLSLASNRHGPQLLPHHQPTHTNTQTHKHTQTQTQIQASCRRIHHRRYVCMCDPCFSVSLSVFGVLGLTLSCVSVSLSLVSRSHSLCVWCAFASLRPCLGAHA